MSPPSSDTGADRPAGGPGGRPRPSAFISWAHVHRGLDPQQWQRSVFRFASTLNQHWIDVDIDLAHLHDDDIDWSTYGVRAIERSDYVLLVTSSAYKERWEGTGDPTLGAGSAREANALKGLFDSDRAAFLKRVKVVLLPGVDAGDVPTELRSFGQRFTVASFDLEGVGSLLRTLTGQAEWVLPPPSPEYPTLPPKFVEGIESVSRSAGAAPDADRPIDDALRARLDDVAEELAAAEAGRRREDLRMERASIEGALDSLQGVRPHRGGPRGASTPAPAGALKDTFEELLEWFMRPAVIVVLVALIVGVIVAGTWWGTVGLLLLVPAVLGVGLLVDEPWPVLAVPVAAVTFVIADLPLPAGVAAALALVAGAHAGGGPRWSVAAAATVAVAVGGWATFDGLATRDHPGRTADLRGATPSPSPAATSSEPTPAATEPPASDRCSDPALTGSEREMDGGPSNDDAEAADGPLEGGTTIVGETQTQNDEDWLFFCAAGEPTRMRLLSVDPDSECDGLAASVRDEAGEEVLDEPLYPFAGTAALDAAALKPGAVYRVVIAAESGARCEWRFGVGPPGVVFDDPEPPTDVPCLPAAETSSASQDGGLEPNEAIDHPVIVASPPFSRDGDALTASGRIASANDAEWFAFCSGDERRAVTIRLTNLGYREYERCEEVYLALRDAAGEELDAQPEAVQPDVQEISWTTEPNSRYYVEVAEDSTDRCRWKLRIEPTAVIVDRLPVAAWAG